jgi:hypothetical protein
VAWNVNRVTGPAKDSIEQGGMKVTSPDPLYIVKRDRIDTLKKAAVIFT